MKIGIPKGLCVYDYPILFVKFFELLGCDVVLSDDTTQELLQKGIDLSIDENCLASKIFLGHVANLVERSKEEKIDYIFVPRISFFQKKETVCVKYYALYDICKNIFEHPFITLNVDYSKGENEFKAYVRLGKKLQKSYSSIVSAYIKARNMQKMYDQNRLKAQQERLASNQMSDHPNILLVSHDYISRDEYLGIPIRKQLENLGANIYFASMNHFNDQKNAREYKKISKSVYWRNSIKLLNGVSEYLSQVDGIIYLSVFPCGTDCLVNELAIRKIKQIPCLNIILDEQDASAGLYTRLESFMDILTAQKALKEVSV